jgi:hypothetical protein
MQRCITTYGVLYTPPHVLSSLKHPAFRRIFWWRLGILTCSTSAALLVNNLLLRTCSTASY